MNIIIIETGTDSRQALNTTLDSRSTDESPRRNASGVLTAHRLVAGEAQEKDRGAGEDHSSGGSLRSYRHPGDSTTRKRDAGSVLGGEGSEAGCEVSGGRAPPGDSKHTLKSRRSAEPEKEDPSPS